MGQEDNLQTLNDKQSNQLQCQSMTHFPISIMRHEYARRQLTSFDIKDWANKPSIKVIPQFSLTPLKFQQSDR